FAKQPRSRRTPILPGLFVAPPPRRLSGGRVAHRGEGETPSRQPARRRRYKFPRGHYQEKYFTAILCHSGQSCLELSPQTSSQCGIPLAFKIAENLTFWSRQMSQSAEPSTMFIFR